MFGFRFTGWWLAGWCLCASVLAAAQVNTPLKAKSAVYQAGFHTGFIFAHSVEVQNTAGARPQVFELAAAHWRNDSLLWNMCRCGALQGLVVAYHNYDTDILGRGLSASYLLEPVFRLSKRSAVSLRTVAGVAYLTRPYHPQNNPANQSYSTTMSAYLALGAGYWTRLNDHWQVGTQVQYQHISNGGLRQPNKGINWPTGGLTVNYSLQPRVFGSLGRSAAAWESKIRWDASLFGVAKRVGGQADGIGLRYLVAGVNLRAARQVGRLSSVVGGVELLWDDALGAKLRSDSSSLHPWRLSVTAGHEFILGRFLFSQQLGLYAYQAGRYFDLLYHRWGLAYRMSPRWMAGISLKAHRHVADFTDVRLTYSF